MSSRAWRKIQRRRRRRQQRIKRLIISGVFLFVLGGSFKAISAIGHSLKQIEVSDPEKESIETVTKYIQETLTTATTPLEPDELSYRGSMVWSDEDAYLLAKIAMAEAEGEDTEGKALVILTVLNRAWAPQFPDTIEAVITQKNAFTSYHNGRWDCVEPDSDCYAALHLVQVEHWDESQGALYFERTNNEETWHSRNMVKLFEHGNHTFYGEKEMGKS